MTTTPRQLTADCYLIVEHRPDAFPARKQLAVIGGRQSSPVLQPNQRAVKVRVVMDESVFQPVPTPETTITVTAPIAPEPHISVEEAIEQ